jgi:hypothetical protein
LRTSRHEWPLARSRRPGAPPPRATLAAPASAAPARAKRAQLLPKRPPTRGDWPLPTARRTGAGGPATSTPRSYARAFRAARRADNARGTHLDDDRGDGARATSPDAPVTASYPRRSAPGTARRTCACVLPNNPRAPQGHYTAPRSLCITLGPTACRPLLEQDADQHGCSTLSTLSPPTLERREPLVRDGVLDRAFLHVHHAAVSCGARHDDDRGAGARAMSPAGHPTPPIRGDLPPPPPRQGVGVRALDRAPCRPASRRHFVCAARPSDYHVGLTPETPRRGATLCSCAAVEVRLSNRRGQWPDRGPRLRSADASARSPRPAAPPPRAAPVSPTSAAPARAKRAQLLPKRPPTRGDVPPRLRGARAQAGRPCQRRAATLAPSARPAAPQRQFDSWPGSSCQPGPPSPALQLQLHRKPARAGHSCSRRAGGGSAGAPGVGTMCCADAAARHSRTCRRSASTSAVRVTVGSAGAVARRSSNCCAATASACRSAARACPLQLRLNTALRARARRATPAAARPACPDVGVVHSAGAVARRLSTYRAASTAAARPLGRLRSSASSRQ